MNKIEKIKKYEKTIKKLRRKVKVKMNEGYHQKEPKKTNYQKKKER